MVQDWHLTKSVEGKGGSDKQKSKTINTSTSLQRKLQQIPLEKQSGCVTKSKLEKTALIWEFKPLKPLRNERWSEVSQPCLLITEDIYF